MESDIIKALREVGKAIQADERYNTLLEKRKAADEDQRVKAIQEQMADLQIKHDEEAMKSNPNQVLMEECQTPEIIQEMQSQMMGM